jgi:hypothetical protein
MMTCRFKAWPTPGFMSYCVKEKFLNELMALDGTNDIHELENDGEQGT